jgi:hypothetical protein
MALDLPISDVRADTGRRHSIKSFPLLVDSQLVLQYFFSRVKVYWEEKILQD